MPSFYISFLNFKKTAIDSFVHRQVGLQCYISEPGGGMGGVSLGAFVSMTA